MLCNHNTTGNSSFVVAKPSTRHRKLSLNHGKSVVLSPLLLRDRQLKGDGGRGGHEAMCKLHRLEL